MSIQATPRILPSHLHAFAPGSSSSSSSHLSHNQQQQPITTVRVLGTITSLRGDQASLESCNGEVVGLVLARDSHLSLSHVYEVIGKVINLEGGLGLGLRVLGATEWKSSSTSTSTSTSGSGSGSARGAAGAGAGTGMPAGIDMAAYEAVVDATHRFRGLFYDGAGAGGQDGMY